MYLVATRRFHIQADSVGVAEAIALTETSERWPGLIWLIADTEEDTNEH